ncbi:hypothetical protein L2E82_08360 [Cichorium intybus]|uniref:Uncharacterized protein n=1 Tax=Cichorium intybus TaxID=13427 RepID=A0ACB9G7D9_CICIN|nr:hypothetical protein L2E82_08360 [Cichorium intybus]
MNTVTRYSNFGTKKLIDVWRRAACDVRYQRGQEGRRDVLCATAGLAAKVEQNRFRQHNEIRQEKSISEIKKNQIEKMGGGLGIADFRRVEEMVLWVVGHGGCSQKRGRCHTPLKRKHRI